MTATTFRAVLSGLPLAVSIVIVASPRCTPAAAIAFPLDPPDGLAGVISHETEAASQTGAASFGGDLTGDLDLLGFSFGTGNNYALASDIMVQRSQTLASAVGTLDYTVITTISGLTFDLADAEVRFGDTVWHTLPTLTPTGGLLASTIDATFTPVIGGPIATNGTAAANVALVGDLSAVQPASIIFNPALFAPIGGHELDLEFEVELLHTGLAITLPGGGPVDLASLIAPDIADHYNTALTLTGFIESTAPVPEPTAAALAAVGFAALVTYGRRRLRHARASTRKT